MLELIEAGPYTELTENVSERAESRAWIADKYAWTLCLLRDLLVDQRQEGLNSNVNGDVS